MFSLRKVNIIICQNADGEHNSSEFMNETSF